MEHSGTDGSCAEIEERLLTEIVRPLTGLDDVDPCIDLYELGMDSMAMMHLLVQIEDFFDLDLSSTGIWEDSGADVTVRRLAGLISAQGDS